RRVVPRDRSRPWKRAVVDTTQVGVPPAPRGPGDDTSVELHLGEIDRAGHDPDTQRVKVDPDTQPVRPVGDETVLVPSLQLRAQAPADLAAHLARIREAPADPEARHALR